ncbi:MAG: hypothetical protein MUC88_11990 [Planctomycetes bacterium]|nr:hypothetical protein [Planctomycetota bacterium]
MSESTAGALQGRRTETQTERKATDRPGLTERLRTSRERTAGNSSSTTTQTAPPSGAGGSQEQRAWGSRGFATRGSDGNRVEFGRRSGTTESQAERNRSATGLRSLTGRSAPQVTPTESQRRALNSRLTEQRQRTWAPSAGSVRSWGSSSRSGFSADAHFGSHRPLYLHGRYYDRPDLIRHSDRHIHMYYDPYHRLHHRVVWPSYCYPVYYEFGPQPYVHYVWPYYHRKYVFVSLGGWWPSYYPYTRYYWYGYHPYVWYGYYPVAREVVVGSDNYYTYNYNYYGDDGSYTTYSSDTPVDAATQAELRARLEQQKTAEPAAPTLADTRFDEGVKSFEAGDFLPPRR